MTSILATVFVVGRLLHAVGMKSGETKWQPRVRGMKLTFLSLIAIGIANLVVVGMLVFAR